jgi:hypothetical protein
VRIAVCTVKAAVGALLIGAGANGAGMPKGGTIRIFVVPGNGQGNGTIVVGAIGDYGKTTKQVGGFGQALLHKGTFKVNLKAISKAVNKAKPLVYNTTTCSYAFSATAPAAISNGTGAYEGISGTLVLTENFAGYGASTRLGRTREMQHEPQRQPDRPLGIGHGSRLRQVRVGREQPRISSLAWSEQSFGGRARSSTRGVATEQAEAVNYVTC